MAPPSTEWSTKMMIVDSETHVVGMDTDLNKELCHKAAIKYMTERFHYEYVGKSDEDTELFFCDEDAELVGVLVVWCVAGGNQPAPSHKFVLNDMYKHWPKVVEGCASEEGNASARLDKLAVVLDAGKGVAEIHHTIAGMECTFKYGFMDD